MGRYLRYFILCVLYAVHTAFMTFNRFLTKCFYCISSPLNPLLQKRRKWVNKININKPPCLTPFAKKAHWGLYSRSLTSSVIYHAEVNKNSNDLSQNYGGYSFLKYFWNLVYSSFFLWVWHLKMWPHHPIPINIRQQTKPCCFTALPSVVWYNYHGRIFYNFHKMMVL